MQAKLQPLRRPRLPLLAGGAKLRIAQLAAVHPFESAELFPSERWPILQRFAPHVLAGSAADLQRVVERMDLRTLELTSLDHSLYVLTEIGDQPLTEALRVTLWQRFGVPIYEVYADGSGAVLAYECEAHCGWHVETGKRFAVFGGELLLQRNAESAVRTGLKRLLESEECACGRGGVRIVMSSAAEAGAFRPATAPSYEEPILAAIA